ncbi:hypothetical protein MKW92_008869 [Papaver armeniacum]|nr:hypothetical protein MKW92_008869 [Papaver armeniacum]
MGKAGRISRGRKMRRLKSTAQKHSSLPIGLDGMIISPVVKKYWFQRYNLFSLYDEGIQMDEEGWYSVTPEEIAIKHAEKAAAGGGVIIDCFSGVGGNSIQFAKKCSNVIAIDINPQKVALANSNAKIYGVEEYIDFVVGDFFQLASSLEGDVVFLTPPWGGPTYTTVEKFTLDLLQPKDGYSIFQAAQKITPNIIMFLPRNVNLHQVEELSWLSSPPLNLQIEENYVEGRLKGITAYFGDTASTSTELWKSDEPDAKRLKVTKGSRPPLDHSGDGFKARTPYPIDGAEVVKSISENAGTNLVQPSYAVTNTSNHALCGNADINTFLDFQDLADLYKTIVLACGHIPSLAVVKSAEVLVILTHNLLKVIRDMRYAEEAGVVTLSEDTIAHWKDKIEDAESLNFNIRWVRELFDGLKTRRESGRSLGSIIEPLRLEVDTAKKDVLVLSLKTRSAHAAMVKACFDAGKARNAHNEGKKI